MEVSLEKFMLIFVGLSVTAMICVPLIGNGLTQISDQYARSQFESMVSSIDSTIWMALNSTAGQVVSADVYIPRGVTISSMRNSVTFNFARFSIDLAVRKQYPLNVSASFDYGLGWYCIQASVRNATLIMVIFEFLRS